MSKKAGATKKATTKRGEQVAAATEVPAVETPTIETTGFDPLALQNGKVIDLAAAKKAIKIYSPKSKIPTAPGEIALLLREVVAKRLEEVDGGDHLLCGDQDDPTDGCRELATGDVSFCPFCGDAGTDPEEVDEGAGDAPTEALGATEAGLVELQGELADARARFDTLRRDLVANAYDIGLTLRDIRDRELWKACGTSSLKEYMERELGLSRTTGYRYMALTEEYDRATFLEIGPKKLELISGLDKSEDREAALQAAREGASTREIEASAGAPPRPDRAPPERERGSKSGTAAPVALPKGAITLLAKVGGKAVKLPFRGAESGRPLKAYKTGAYAEYQLSDDVVVRVALTELKDGTFEGITLAFIRVE